MNNELLQEISNAISALRRDELILFPDEIGWSVGCSLKSRENIIALSGERNATLLLDEFARMHKYCRDIPATMEALNEYTTKPLNFEIENPVNIPPEVQENSFASFRIVREAFVKALVNKFYHVSGTLLASFLLDDQSQPRPQGQSYHKPVYIVNLRRSMKTDAGSLVIVRVSSKGNISIIKK